MITSKTIANGLLRALIMIVLAVGLLYFLYKIKSIIIYVIVSLVLTLIANPFVEFLKNRLKFKNTPAVVVTITAMLLVFATFILMFVPLIISQSKSLSLLNTKSIENSSVALLNELNVFLIKYNIDAGNLLKESNIASKLDFNFIPTFINSILSVLAEFGMGLASVLFITFFFLKDKVKFIVGVKKIIPAQQQEKVLKSLEKIYQLLNRYFIGLIIQLLIVFILYIIVLLIFGVKNAFVIALLCAVLNIIPYIGPLIGSVLAAILTMISNLDADFQTEILPTTFFVLLGFWVVQLIDNNFSQPIIFSKSVKSHPLEIFLTTLVSGFLFGIMGMIVAIPCFTIIKVIGKEFIPENAIIKVLTKDI